MKCFVDDSSNCRKTAVQDKCILNMRDKANRPQKNQLQILLGNKVRKVLTITGPTKIGESIKKCVYDRSTMSFFQVII